MYIIFGEDLEFMVKMEWQYIIIDVHDIICTNNSDYGFLFANIDNGQVYNNKASQSGNQNEKDSNCRNVTLKNNQW